MLSNGFYRQVNCFPKYAWLMDRKIEAGRLGRFARMTNLIEVYDYQLKEELRHTIILQLKVLRDEFTRYFPDIRKSDFNFARNPFVEKVQDCIADDLDEVQEEFLHLINDSNAKVLFSTLTIPQFWCSMLSTYPLVAQIATKSILPFPSTYLCKSGFSSLLTIKTKNRNRLDVGPDLRCCLSKTEPRNFTSCNEKAVPISTLAH